MTICLERGADCCIWPSWCYCHTKTPPSLDAFKSRLVSPLWYRLIQVVLEKRPLNGCSCIVTGHHNWLQDMTVSTEKQQGHTLFFSGYCLWISTKKFVPQHGSVVYKANLCKIFSAVCYCWKHQITNSTGISIVLSSIKKTTKNSHKKNRTASAKVGQHTEKRHISVIAKITTGRRQEKQWQTWRSTATWWGFEVRLAVLLSLLTRTLTLDLQPWLLIPESYGHDA